MEIRLPVLTVVFTAGRDVTRMVERGRIVVANSLPRLRRAVDARENADVGLPTGPSSEAPATA